MSHYDPRDPLIKANPFPIYKELHQHAPVHFNDVVGGWVITRFDHVQDGLKDPRLSSDRISPAMQLLSPERQDRMRELSTSLRTWTVFADPPTHTRLRNLFNRAFTPRAIDRLRVRIDQIVDELLTRALGRGSIEFIDEFAYPLPALIICEMIGIPRSDLASIQVWSDAVATFIGIPKKPWESFLAADEANHSMIEYFRELVADHKRSPRPDILMSLIEATDQGQRLTEEELVATCILLLFAAHTTTTHLLGNGVLALAQSPAQLAKLRENPTLIDSAVEELLRYDGPIQAVRRNALETLDIGGHKIDEGDLVFFMINAANRDPLRFPDPDALDITRKDNRHVAFGMGIHFCPGAALARVEARAAFGALLRRTRAFEVTTTELSWLDSFGFRGVRKLSLRLTV